MEHERSSPEPDPVDRERWDALRDLEAWLETPILILSLVWLALLVVELTRGLSPALEGVATGIWIVFILDFILRFSLAPVKSRFLKSSWLTAVSLLIPALRVFRVARLVRLLRLSRATRGLRLAKVVASINRGARTLRAHLKRRRLGLVLSTTGILAFVGAAAMLAFEKDVNDPRGLHDYGTALWWTAMVLTTMGTEYWPRTLEGRVLTFFLALYAFAFFGYVTAALATFFIGEDRKESPGESPGASTFRNLEQEVRRLRESLELAGRGRGAPADDAGGPPGPLVGPS
jgi:voltage-gated potassium channel